MNNQYQALARKYRPSTLHEVVGHKSIINALTNNIENDRIHHAMLFTGTRGVGKTTLARIIALSVNCLANDKPTTKPCLKCNNCISIINSNSTDVIECDAASRTGVDSVREIIENCSYPPINARKKIYIIDEVHMLSKAAFNAFLKTLEEPSGHLIFIFATTEINKIPITVLSRCQKFTLHNVSKSDLAANIVNVATKENLTVEDDAAAKIAEMAKGSVRDSLSLFDAIIAGSESTKIDLETVNKAMQLSDEDYALQMLNLIIEGNGLEALDLAEKIISVNINIDTFLQQFVQHILQILQKQEIPEVEINKEIVAIMDKHNISAAQALRYLNVGKAIIKDAGYFEASMVMQMLITQCLHAAKLPQLQDIIK